MWFTRSKEPTDATNATYTTSKANPQANNGSNALQPSSVGVNGKAAAKNGITDALAKLTPMQFAKLVGAPIILATAAHSVEAAFIVTLTVIVWRMKK